MEKNEKYILDYKKKDRKKSIRTVFQMSFLVVVFGILINAFFNIKSYEPLNSSLYNNNEGFIAISYFGVDRIQKPTLIDNDMLSKHLSAMKASGFETISQQDIIEYYKEGKPLPQKAMYISFEDGRKDSALFAQPIMEKLNYKATMFTYANKFVIGDMKFLMPKDLKKMEKSTFWELGSNGYRFEYINVFDRFNNFLNILNQDQFNMVAKYMEEDYNHYLMDFIRDKNGIPVENRTEMEKRIKWDYAQMRDIYTKELGGIPNAYMIMHANGLYGDASPLATNVNNEEIKKTFKLHFNNEGKSFNGKEEDIYKLTRLQVQPYWYTNHLLMRVWQETGKDVAFEQGDVERARLWEIVEGQGEFIKSKIVLTSPPEKPAFMYLKDKKELRDLKISASLEGNVVGEQAIYLRYNSDNSSFVRVSLKDNELFVHEKKSDNSITEIFKCNLKDIDKKPAQSIAEVMLEAEINEGNLNMKRARNEEEKNKIKEQVTKKKEQITESIEDGAKEFVPNLKANQLGKRMVEIRIKGSNLDILVDGKVAVKDLKIDESITSGYLALEASASERNTKDKVYDGVFDNIFVQELLEGQNEEGKIIFDSRLKGFEKIYTSVKEHYNHILDWFIETF
ncbi:polysaccharide deacetylase family protein [Clostridium sp. MSJ-11]|uniref:Polysaccharide deacetylase family protein n=1 Tax=Clostridium mobile TaxID=2841512 RepID=A0ABS6EM78_9CLOT|nr:polysaccharide deacetylase family protein [Clostridium mobile]MBU5485857.1 polysaccharide deacetylase family protein [Clostridium mobile]